jgi:hypothetical protein
MQRVEALPLTRGAPHCRSLIVISSVWITLATILAVGPLAMPRTAPDYALPCAILTLYVPGLVCLAYGIISASRAIRTLRAVPDREGAIIAAVSDIRWPLGGGGGPQGTFCVEAVSGAGIHAVIDSELAAWAAEVPLPQGLLEPVPVSAAPGARGGGGVFVTGCVSVALIVVLTPGPILLVGMRFGVTAAILAGLAMVLLLVVNLTRQHAGLQRRFAGTPVIGRILRSRVGRRGLVIGPGWARSGSRFWHVGQDLLLIRQVRGRKPKTAVQLMLTGAAGRVCLTLAGLKDPMLEAIWAGWMTPEPRPDLAETELASATG